MKKLLILSLCTLIFACGSDDDPAPVINQDDFNISLQPPANNIFVGQTFVVTVTEESPFASVQMSTDNFLTWLTCNPSNNSNELDFHLEFDTPGQKTIAFKVFRANNDSAVAETTINVMRGDAVKITGLQILSFHNMDQSWDPEFSSTDPDRLADLQFGLTKMGISACAVTGGSEYLWFHSPVLQNQGNMTWSLNSDDLYFLPNEQIGFGLSDVDGGVPQDIINSFPGKNFNLASYIATKPESITFDFPDVNLSFVVMVEWPE